MFKQIFRLSRPYSLNQILSGTSKQAAAIYPNVTQGRNTRMFSTIIATKKWDLYSAVCLERHPIIIQSMEEIELKFSNILQKIEYENSLKSDHELRREKEEREKKSKSIDIDEDTDAIVQTVQDVEDSWQEELNSFKFAPTITSINPL